MLASVIQFINSGMTGHRWLGGGWGVLACKVHYYLHLVLGLIEPEVNRMTSGRKNNFMHSFSHSHYLLVPFAFHVRFYGTVTHSANVNNLVT